VVRRREGVLADKGRPGDGGKACLRNEVGELAKRVVVVTVSVDYYRDGQPSGVRWPQPGQAPHRLRRDAPAVHRSPDEKQGLPSDRAR